MSKHFGAMMVVIVGAAGCATSSSPPPAQSAVTATSEPPATALGGLPPATPASSTPAVAPPVEDAHWFQPDDYLIKGGSQCGATIGKLLEAARPETKNEAKFFATHSAKEVWTKSFWRTRPATQADFKVGAEIFCAPDHVVVANKERARTGSWDPGRITDTSDLYKGLVRYKRDTGCCCGETYSCPVSAARVPIPFP